jgi:ferritin-like metal-binding protein YciE
MTMRSKDELFEHELKDIYDAEHKLKGALKKLATKSKNDPELADLFTTHLGETQGHIERLQEVFQTIEKRAARRSCEGINGLLKEHAELMRDEKPVGDVLRTVNIASALKTEHYEMVSYQSLIDIARELGNTRAASLLELNLAEEQNAASKLERQAKRGPATRAD